MERASLNRGHFQNAWMCTGIFREAEFKEANLGGVSALHSDFERADFFKANMERAFFSFSNLRKANLFGSNLKKANLTQANLVEAIISGSRLQEANLALANAQKADFGEAHLQRACLFGANLQRARMYGTELDGAWLVGSNLRGVEGLETKQVCKAGNLSNAELDADLLESVLQQCPKLLEPIAEGVEYCNEWSKL